MGMELTKSKNVSYARYEEVLLRRENLKKKAEEYHLAFIREFGDLITKAFELKIECIRKKKMIAYCQRLANRGLDIDRRALDAFIEREMLEYQMELEEMIEAVGVANSGTPISPLEVKKIKTIYYALVKLIHPDLHPELADDEILKEYWNRIKVAYTYNNLQDITELDTLVRKYLADHDHAIAESEIEDIDGKIAKIEEEIETIITTDPFLYRLILNDPQEIKEKKQAYEDEIESYRKYAAQLDDVLQTFEIREAMLS